MGPVTGEHTRLRADIDQTLPPLAPPAMELKAAAALLFIRKELAGSGNDASWLRALHEQERLLPEVVRRQCLRWAGRDD